MKRKSPFLIGALILTMCATMLYVPVSADTVDANETLYYYDSFDADTDLDKIKGNWNGAPDYSWPDGWGDTANGWYSGKFSYANEEGRGKFVKYENNTSGAVQANMKMNVSENIMLSNLDWKTFTGNLVFSYDFKLPEQNENTKNALYLLERPALKYHYTDKDGNAQSFVVAELPHIEIKAASANYNNGIYINTPGKSLVNNGGTEYGTEKITEVASATELTKSDAFFEVTAKDSGYTWGDWVNFETVISKAEDGSYTVRCYLDGNVIYNRFYNLAKEDWGWSGANALTAFAAYKVTSDPMKNVEDYTPKGFTCFDGITTGLVKTPVRTYVGFDNFKMAQYGTTALPEHISVDETTDVTKIPIYNSLTTEQSSATQGYIVANRIPGGNKAIAISSVKKYTGHNQTTSTTVADHGITVDLSGIDSIRLNIPEAIRKSMSNGDKYEIMFANLYDIIGSRQGKYTESQWLYNVAGQDFTNSTVIISGKDYDSTYKNVTLREGSEVVTNNITKYALVNDIRVDTRDTVASNEISLVDEEGQKVNIKAVTFDAEGDGTEDTNWKVKGRYYINLADNTCLVGGTTYRILKGDKILTTIEIPESAVEFSVKNIKLNDDKKPTATFENRTKSPVTYMFIVAEYDNANKNELDEAALKRYTVKSGERYWETLDLKITDPKKTYTLFVWDENLTPFVNAIPVQVQN